MLIDRAGSTLGIMDDVQFAIHSYDGCHKGCPGCLVDKYFKNKARFNPIIGPDDQELIHRRVTEYYDWVSNNLNSKSYGYFGKNGYNVNHYSYTFRFGNHGELNDESLLGLCERMDAPFKVFSTAPAQSIDNFIELNKQINGRLFLEIIYDPIVDDPEMIAEMVQEMRENGIHGYPEILVTRRLLDVWSDASAFVDHALAPLDKVGSVQVQFGRYSPSRTRNFSTTQLVPLDEEVEWLAAVARRIVESNLDIHPIPLGEYAVTFLDEYGESKVWTPNGVSDDDAKRLWTPDRLQLQEDIHEIIRDIYITSLYIDHKMDVFIWAESMGQHVLNDDLGFRPLGNIRKQSLIDIVRRGGPIDLMVSKTVMDLKMSSKCQSCGYKSFCSTHAIYLFRKWERDDGKHCYGYIPVIREFQKDPDFLNRMIQGFKELGF